MTLQCIAACKLYRCPLCLSNETTHSFSLSPTRMFHSTSAMLKVLYANHKAPDKDLSFQEVLLKMRTVLSQGKYEQIPQLSASRPLDIQ
jgi:hypothetical protein